MNTIKTLLFAPLIALSLPANAGIIDTFIKLIPGAGYSLESVDNFLNGREFYLRVRSEAGSCNPALMEEVFQPAIDRVIEMRQSISEDQATGITRWNFDDPYGKQRISEFER